MFSIGFIELMVIAIVGLLVVGPDKLPGAIRETTLWIGRIRRYIHRIRLDIEDQLEDLESDAALVELREGRRLFDEARRELNKPVMPADGGDARGPASERPS